MRRREGDGCPIWGALQLVGDKWTMLVVRDLARGPRRTSELIEALHPISSRTLVDRLRDMERDELVERHDRGGSPPHVEYVLTERGLRLLPLLDALRAAGEALDCNGCDDRLTRHERYCDACPHRPHYRDDHAPRRSRAEENIVLLQNGPVVMVSTDFQMNEMSIRPVEPADHARVVEVMDEWWRGSMAGQLMPRLFFVHFNETSFVAERGRDLVGFLVGFLSQTFPEEAYIHFVGVSPEARRGGLGRKLYETFFEVVRGHGRTVVRCVTSPANEESLAFHARLGFEIEPQEHEEEGVPVLVNHDGRGNSRVLFVKRLDG